MVTCVDAGIESEAQSAIRAARRYAGDIDRPNDRGDGMKAKRISAMENAYAEGSDWASERPKSAKSAKSSAARLAQYRSTILRDFESRKGCALCPAGVSLADFLPLLAEFERGFEETMSAATASKKNPGKILKRLAGQASAVAALLSAIDALPADEQESALLTCSRLTDAFSRGLDAFVGEQA
jgi:hypothetical protein